MGLWKEFSKAVFKLWHCCFLDVESQSVCFTSEKSTFLVSIKWDAHKRSLVTPVFSKRQLLLWVYLLLFFPILNKELGLHCKSHFPFCTERFWSISLKVYRQFEMSKAVCQMLGIWCVCVCVWVLIISTEKVNIKWYRKMSCIFQSISRKFIFFSSLNNHLLFGNFSPFIFFFLIWVKKREISHLRV